MWEVRTTDRFDVWFDNLDDVDRACVLAGMLLLKERGPLLARPFAYSVAGSAFANMK